MGYRDWLTANPERRAQAQESVQYATGSVWELLGDDWYTCVPPPGFEPDPAVVAALRTFDPDAIPIWRIQRWRVPGRRSPVPIVHVGIARVSEHPEHQRSSLNVQMPQEPDHDVPNLLDTFLEGESLGPGGPNAYRPLDWASVAELRASFGRLDVVEFDRRIAARQAREAKMRADWQDDLEYRRRDVEPRILRILDERVGEYDWKQLAHLYRYGPQRAKGRKPFVQVRGVAPSGAS